MPELTRGGACPAAQRGTQEKVCSGPGADRAVQHLSGVLGQLRPVIGPGAPMLLGFDGGGAFPVVFTGLPLAGALAPLAEDLNATPPRLPGDRRAITYRVTPA